MTKAWPRAPRFRKRRYTTDNKSREMARRQRQRQPKQDRIVAAASAAFGKIGRGYPLRPDPERQGAACRHASARQRLLAVLGWAGQHGASGLRARRRIPPCADGARMAMTDAHIRHLTPIDAEIVANLCRRLAAFPLAFGDRLELHGFKTSRSPWDARRLANALHMFKMAPEIVAELDKLALELGGLEKDHTRGT